MNLYLCTVRKLLAGGRSTVRAQYSGGWFRFDKGRMPGRRSSTVGSRRVRFGSRARTRNRRCTILAATYVDLDLTDSSNGTHTQRRTTRGSTKQKISALRKFLGLAVKERARHSFLHSYS